MILFMVAVGGAAGAVARYGLSGWVQAFSPTSFPWGTLAVNVLGSLLLGFGFRFMEGLAVGPEVRALATVGFLGAFTTFSTFSYETLALLQDREWTSALVYSLGSVALGLSAAVAGVLLANAALHLEG